MTKADVRTKSIAKDLAKVLVDKDMGIREDMKLRYKEWKNNNIKIRFIDFSFLVELEVGKLL